MNTTANNTARNTSKDDVSNVIDAIISSVVKSETAIYSAIKYLHSRYEFEYGYRALQGYMVAVDDKADKTTAYAFRNKLLTNSDEYAKLAKQLVTLEGKRKEDAGNETVKRDFDQINKRMTAVHMKAHDALVGAYALAAMKHKNKDAIIDFADKKSRISVLRVKDKDGDPVNYDLSGEAVKKQGRTIFAETQSKAPKTAGAGNVAKDAKAASQIIDAAEFLIGVCQGHINNKKDILDNEAYGAILGGLLAKMITAASFDDKGNIRPVREITEPDMMNVLIKGYAAHTQRNAKAAEPNH